MSELNGISFRTLVADTKAGLVVFFVAWPLCLGIAHLVGHDPNPEGEMAFSQPNLETTFSELSRMFGDVQLGSAMIGLGSSALLALWDQWRPLKKSLFPAPVAVVLLGVGAAWWFEQLGDPWFIDAVARENVLRVVEELRTQS